LIAARSHIVNLANVGNLVNLEDVIARKSLIPDVPFLSLFFPCNPSAPPLQCSGPMRSAADRSTSHRPAPYAKSLRWSGVLERALGS
jgi:hypothetical protein